MTGAVAAAAFLLKHPDALPVDAAPGSGNGRAVGARQWDRGRNSRAGAQRAVDFEPTVDHGEAVREPHQPGPGRAGASHPVVAHLDAQHAVLDPRDDLGMPWRGVLATLVSASATTK